MNEASIIKAIGWIVVRFFAIAQDDKVVRVVRKCPEVFA